MDDMKEECQKYGSVVSLLIPRENPGKGQVCCVVFKPPADPQPVSLYPSFSALSLGWRTSEDTFTLSYVRAKARLGLESPFHLVPHYTVGGHGTS